MSLKPLFVLPLGVYDYPRHQEFKEVIIDHISDKVSDITVDDVNIDHLYNYEYQNLFNDFDHPEVQTLKDFILRRSDEYIKEVMGYTRYEELMITNSWLNMSTDDCYLGLHHHGCAMIAANYFINFNPNVHAPLTFANPFYANTPMPKLSPWIDQPSPFSTLSNTPPQKEGQILIWPGGLDHGFEYKNTTANRVTLSMNIIPNRVNTGVYEITISECKK